MQLIHFDQGPLGHERRKPTTLGTNLHRLQGLGEMSGPGQGGEAWLGDLSKRIAQRDWSRRSRTR